MEKQIIIQVQADGYSTVAAARQEVKQLTAAQKELDKQLQEGKISQEAYIKATAENIKAEREASNRKKETLKAINELDKAQKESAALTKERTGSLVEMRKELSTLKKAYTELSKAEREGAKGTELQDKIKGLNDEVLGIEKGIGVFSRNVGNYAGSLSPLFDDLKGSLLSTNGAFSQMAKGAAGSFGSLGAASKSLGTAMSSIPVFQLVQAFTLLMDWIGKFDGALDGLEVALAGVKAAFGPVVEFIASLATGLLENVVNYFKTLGNVAVAAFKAISGDVEGASKSLKDAEKNMQAIANTTTSLANEFTNLGGKMTEAARKAMEMEKAIQELDAREAEYNFKKVRALKEIELAELKAADRSLTTKQRQDALNKAKETAIALDKEGQQIASERATQQVNDVLKMQNMVELQKESGVFTAKEIELVLEALTARDKQGRIIGKYEEQVAALEKAMTKQLQVETNANKISLEYAAKSSKLVNAARAEAAEAARKQAEAIQALHDAEKEYQQLQVELATTDEQRMRAKQGLLKLQLEDDLKAAKSAKMRAALQAKYQQDIAAMEDEYVKNRTAKQLEQQKADAAQVEEFGRQVIANEVKAIQDRAKARELALIQAAASGAITEQELQAQRAASEQQALEELYQIQKKYNQDTLQSETQLAQNKLAIRRKDLEQQRAIADAQIATAKNVVNSLATLGQILMANSASAGEFAKALALFRIGIDTAQSIASVVRIASTSSIDPITYGVQLSAGIASVLTNIANATQILNASAQPQAPQVQRARSGGLIGGNLHANGGTLIEAEMGEAIMTRSAVAMFGPQLSAMNVAAGGSAITSGAFMADMAVQNQQQSSMLELIKALPPSVLNVRTLAREERNDAVARTSSRLAMSQG